VGDRYSLRGISAVKPQSKESWRCKIAGTRDESGVLDYFGADGCGGSWICVGVTGDGNGARIFEVGCCLSSAGIRILVDRAKKP
jgi:hypothetical protein